MSDSKENQQDNGNGYVKTTPENVREAHEALFHATMNLPAACRSLRHDAETNETNLLGIPKISCRRL